MDRKLQAAGRRKSEDSRSVRRSETSGWAGIFWIAVFLGACFVIGTAVANCQNYGTNSGRGWGDGGLNPYGGR